MKHYTQPKMLLLFLVVFLYMRTVYYETLVYGLEFKEYEHGVRTSISSKPRYT